MGDSNKTSLISGQLRSRYNVTPVLSGSMALGTNLPEAGADYDFAVPIRSREKFKRLAGRFGRDFTASKFNKPGTDYQVFSGKLGGEDVDIAILYGDKGREQRAALKRAKAALVDEAKRTEIVNKKRRLLNSWFFPKQRYKRYKRRIDAEIGMPRFRREPLPRIVRAASPEISRADVYAHRTHDITPILRSGRILTAAQAADRGLIRGVETNNPITRTRHVPTEGDFRDEIFVTDKLLPANETYGQYGVLFRSRSAKPSPYLNTIPGEHVIARSSARKLTFVVPDSEIEEWESTYPASNFLPESDVPVEKKTDSARSVSELLGRIMRGAKVRQVTRHVQVRGAD